MEGLELKPRTSTIFSNPVCVTAHNPKGNDLGLLLMRFKLSS